MVQVETVQQVLAERDLVDPSETQVGHVESHLQWRQILCLWWSGPNWECQVVCIESDQVVHVESDLVAYLVSDEIADIKSAK